MINKREEKWARFYIFSVKIVIYKLTQNNYLLPWILWWKRTPSFSAKNVPAKYFKQQKKNSVVERQHKKKLCLCLWFVCYERFLQGWWSGIIRWLEMLWNEIHMRRNLVIRARWIGKHWISNISHRRNWRKLKLK